MSIELLLNRSLADLNQRPTGIRGTLVLCTLVPDILAFSLHIRIEPGTNTKCW